MLGSCGNSAPADAGKLRISADKAGAYIYINGDKKGMTGDEGYTNILLAEGEYKVKIEKITDEWVYTKTRNIFVGADSSVKLSFNLGKVASWQKRNSNA